jgi:hypothetical protein
MINCTDVKGPIDDSLKEVINDLGNCRTNLLKAIENQIKDDSIMVLSLAINDDITMTIERYGELKKKKNPKPFISAMQEAEEIVPQGNSLLMDFDKKPDSVPQNQKQNNNNNFDIFDAFNNNNNNQVNNNISNNNSQPNSNQFDFFDLTKSNQQSNNSELVNNVNQQQPQQNKNKLDDMFSLINNAYSESNNSNQMIPNNVIFIYIRMCSLKVIICKVVE